MKHILRIFHPFRPTPRRFLAVRVDIETLNNRTLKIPANCTISIV